MLRSTHSVTSARQPLLVPMTLVINTGSSSTDEAKMIGTTPAWLTFSGMYVLCPPNMRRPTTRLANCTGMRRWASSTRTITTKIASDSSTMIAKTTHSLSWSSE
jgi:hypothetical protein